MSSPSSPPSYPPYPPWSVLWSPPILFDSHHNQRFCQLHLCRPSTIASAATAPNGIDPYLLQQTALPFALLTSKNGKFRTQQFNRGGPTESKS
ncbi:unnamed protein product [Dovyalis caffra]|uniref:Uncharacterized protein n=1 Tax=Dovyalis caffra TaxID=77055 RepID=A0AAV1S1I7_9ROSI|nr:unnamed protein product [Dovyalis caffra]